MLSQSDGELTDERTLGCRSALLYADEILFCAEN